MVVIPTVDDFKDTTIMRSLRKIVNYIINTVVPGINTAQTTANTATAKLNQLIAQYNIMVAYIGTDAELVTNTAPTTVDPIDTE